MLLDVTALLSSAHADAVAEAFGVSDVQPRIVAVADASLTDTQLAFQAALDGATADPGTTAPIGSGPIATGPIGSGPIGSGSTGSGSTGSGVSASIVTASDITASDVTASGSAPRAEASTSHVAQRVPASQLPKLTGVPLLQQLALLSRSQLTTFAADHAAVLTKLAAHPPAASAVQSWWAGVPSAKQSDLLAAAPGVVGNLEGVPYTVRDHANRSYLEQTERGIRAELRAGAGRAASDDLARRLHMLEQVRASLASGSSRDGRTLINLDPSGSGTAVIVIGDVNTADYVGYLIPGMYSSVDTQIVKFAESAQQIANDQQKMLDTLPPAAAPGSTTNAPTARKAAPTAAVVAWIGYRTPGLANVASLDLAEQAQAALTSSIHGLQAARGAHQPFISIMAHSYGSTAAMLALQNGDLSVDALAICGSPGSPAQSASQLSVKNDNVWVGAASWDPVPETGLFGSQPTAASYGAHRFGVDGATDPATGKALVAAEGHNGYFVPGTESLRNIELIGIDRADLVLP